MRGTGIDRYYLFLFVGIIPWHFFVTSLTGGATCIVTHSSMVKKIYFPREVLPISYVTSSFVNMLYSFVIVFIVVFVSGTHINPVALLYLPVVMLVEYLLALAVTFISSAITVYFRDWEHILHTIAMAWMYFTPLFYSLERVPEQYRKWFILNPMVPIIGAYRDILYSGKIPDMMTLVHASAAGILFLIIGITVFGKLKKHFAEEL
jgi:ABC-2 type transport system permease protein